DKMVRRDGRETSFDTARMEAHPFSAFQHFEVRTGGPLEADPRFPEIDTPVPQTPARRYDVWTFAASHAQPEDEPVFFAIRQLEGPEVVERNPLPALLYATDTGPFPDETWVALDGLREHGVRFQATAIDSTLGAGKDGTGHMSLRQMQAHQQELERRGLLAPGARRLGHHFSHGATPPYEELYEMLAPAGIEPAYDGLVVTL
ncbi:MAG: hypothetical protein ACRDI2_05695, partial [Chloroflexota bacterium]